MASRGRGHITSLDIARLAPVLSPMDLKTIALTQLGLETETIETLEFQNRGDAEELKRQIIKHWVYKNPGPEQKQVLWIRSRYRWYWELHWGAIIPSAPSSSTSAEHLSDEELNDVVEVIKEETRETTGLELGPWAKEYTVAIDKMFTDLTLEKIDNKPTGPEGVELDDYKELFVDDEPQPEEGSSQQQRKRTKKGKKILIKADPGFGKTSLSKKIAYDWATDVFTAVSIVFCIFLKLIRPGQDIENIIIDQYGVLEGIDVSAKRLKQILEYFDNKCLIILDGLDEHDLESKGDIQKIIQGRKLFSCNIILTSRPHSVKDIVNHFQTIVSVKGFTESRAEMFVSKVLQDENKIQAVLEFNSKSLKNEASFHSSPMLLLFICILLKYEEINLQSETMNVGDIYTRLVRCLYRKFIARKGSEFKHSEFVDLLKRVGKVAWEMLQSGRGWMQKSQVIKEVGKDAFDTGLLIGHQGFRSMADETTDILISFPHRTIQEFLGAFYFMLMLSEGETIESLLDSNCQKPIFMTNLLFLQFCVYFLSRKQDYFTFPKETRYKCLTNLIAERIDLIQLDDRDLNRLYPALNQGHTSQMKKDLGPDILGDALALCNSVNDCFLFSKHCLSLEELSEYHRMPNLRLLVLSDRWYPVMGPFSSLTKCSSYNEFNVVIDHRTYGSFDVLMDFCEAHHKNLSLYIMPREEETNLNEYLQGNVRKVYILGNSSLNQRLTAQNDIELCSHLTHLYLMQMTIDESVIKALARAADNNRLQKLRHLSLAGSILESAPDMSVLFDSNLLSLTHLDLNGCSFNSYDFSAISVNGQNKGLLNQLSSLALNFGSQAALDHNSLTLMFQQSLYNLTSLMLNVAVDVYNKFILLLNRGSFSKLKELAMSIQGSADLEEMPNATSLPLLSGLTLTKDNWSVEDLSQLAKSSILKQLHKLDMTHSSGIKGNLSMLLAADFPSLNTLILSDCGLSSQDVCSLAQASAEGRLPELRHLDISKNQLIHHEIESLFTSQCKWERLVALNVQQSNGSGQRSWIVWREAPLQAVQQPCSSSQRYLQQLTSKVASGCLSSLQKLRVSVSKGDTFLNSLTAPWTHLQKIEMVKHPQNTAEILESVHSAIDKNLLPSLHTVNVFVTELPATAEEWDTRMDELEESVNSFIKSVCTSLRNQCVRFDCSRFVAFLAQLDPPVVDRICSAFPDWSHENLESVSNSLSAALTEFFTNSEISNLFEYMSNLESRSEVESENDLRNCVLSLINLPDDQVSITELKHVIRSILGSLLQFVRNQEVAEIRHDPTAAVEAVASLEPPLVQRLSEAFPDADPELLKSVTTSFSDKLVEILPDLFNGSVDDNSLKKMLKVPLVPLLAGKVAAMMGLPLTDKFKSWYHSQATGSYVDPQTETQVNSSFRASDATWRLRQRGVRVYFLLQLDSPYLSDFKHQQDLHDSSTKNYSQRKTKRQCILS